MSGNTYGTLFKITTFGESHGKALGVVIDGCPAGLEIDCSKIQKELDRRRPGSAVKGENSAAVTSRFEPDQAEILSGVFEGKSTGTPIAIAIKNTSQHSSDYGNIKDSYRPGHADFSYDEKYGFRDFRGGGRSSGRETAARVAAGAVAKMLLESKGIKITAYTLKACGIECEKKDFSQIEQNNLRMPDNTAAEKAEEKLELLRSQGNSAGGIIECKITGVPAGLGEPVFDKLDAELAKAIVSIGAVKGIEFGSGFASADSTGSQNNDEMFISSGKPSFFTNNSGGILGGISNGNEIVFRAAIKPVPSIFIEQKTIKKEENKYEETKIEIKGRHDVCLCPRIVPVIESMAAIVVADMILRNKTAKIK